ncbi:brain acid soluble protein 1 [Nonomuraea sp. RK-328]|nr:brain acid soluble protein 1 [Nonomuraea sp. RK-328]
MTTGFTGSSELEGETEEESGAPYDPDATGVIPRIILDLGSAGGASDKDAASGSEAGNGSARAGDDGTAEAETETDGEADTEDKTEAEGGSATGSAVEDAADDKAEDTAGAEAEDDADADTTTAIRLPASFRVGGPPTVPDVTSAARPASPAKPVDPAKPAEEPAKPAPDTSGTSGAAAPPTTPFRATPPQAPPQRPVQAAPQASPRTPAQEAPQARPEAPQESPQESKAPAKSAAAAPKAAPPSGGLAARLGAVVSSAPKWLPALLTVEGLILYVLALRVPPGPLRGVDPANINGLGLISALPASAFAALLIMLVAFFVTVAQSTDRKFLLLFQIATITFALHGAGALVATEPRFPTAYIHAGFVDFIGRTGETAISIDARMGWPGFFALFAFVTKAAGITDMTPILMWTPLLSNLLYLLPFVLILRQVVATTRARWFAALLFVLVQWIGQDYFSPQGFTFALYLAWVAILLRWFGRVEARTKPVPDKGLRKWLGRLDAMTPGEIANTGMFRADKLLMLTLLLAVFFASTASHQITPFMMLGVITAFLIFKRTSLTWALPFFLGLVVLAWISYQAVGFWAGQIDAIFGGLGKILTNLQRNTGDRIAGSDPAHALVLKARLGILVVILSLAATGLLRRLRRGVFDRAALILLCVPVLALGLQSYGGEIGLRIYMFALPGACLLAAYAFFPNLPADSADVREETVPIRKRSARFNPELTRKLSVLLAAGFAVLFAMAFLVARYGNEKFERVTTGEVAAMHYVYAHDKPSARVLYLVPKEGREVTPTLPWGEKDVELVNFSGQALIHQDPTNISDALAKLKASPRNTFLAVTRGQVSYLQLNEGFPEGWGERFRAALDASPEVKKVYSNEDAALYTLKKFVRGTEIPGPQPYKGRGDPTSPWTPLGIAALAVTWLTLFAYEVIRLHGPGRAPRARRRLLFVAVPAFVIAVGVIAERFIYIAVNN